MDRDRVAGAVRNAKDQVEDAYGRATGELRQRAHGLADQATGTAERFLATGKTAASAIVDESELLASTFARGGRRLAHRATGHPLESLLVAAAVGYFFGWLTHQRR